MKRILAVTAPLALAATLLVAGPTPAAHADDRRCVGTIGAVTVDDDIVVPAGKSCTLQGTRVEGNVIVKRGARLVARGVRVDGNIQSQAHRRVVVAPRNGRSSVVEGNIQLKAGRGGGQVLRTVVDGDIQLFSNKGRFVVRGNRVDGNLQCKGNSPRPIGSRNRVEGNKENQCRGL
jgi:hypothetical protein